MEPRDSRLTCIVLYTELDAQCDKLAKVVNRPSTAASVANKIGR